MDFITSLLWHHLGLYRSLSIEYDRKRRCGFTSSSFGYARDEKTFLSAVITSNTKKGKVGYDFSPLIQNLDNLLQNFKKQVKNKKCL